MHCRSIQVNMCIRRETREKARRSLAISPVSKPHTHITYMLQQCTSIVYRGGSRISSKGAHLKKIAPSGGRRENFRGGARRVRPWYIYPENNNVVLQCQKIPPLDGQIFFPHSMFSYNIFNHFFYCQYFIKRNYIFFCILTIPFYFYGVCFYSRLFHSTASRGWPIIEHRQLPGKYRIIIA